MLVNRLCITADAHGRTSTGTISIDRAHVPTARHRAAPVTCPPCPRAHLGTQPDSEIDTHPRLRVGTACGAHHAASKKHRGANTRWRAPRPAGLPRPVVLLLNIFSATREHSPRRAGLRALPTAHVAARPCPHPVGGCTNGRRPVLRQLRHGAARTPPPPR